MYGKPARTGALPLLATPLTCFESAQQLKRPRRERQGSLLQLAMLLTLTRVKLDSSSGRVESGKVVRDTSPSYLLFQTLLPLFWTLTSMI